MGFDEYQRHGDGPAVFFHHHPGGHFLAGKEGFAQHMVPVLEGFLQGIIQLLFILYDHYPDAGALGGRFYHTGDADFLQNPVLGVLVPLLVQEDAFGGRHMVVLEQMLGVHLVHGQGAGQYSAARIGDPQHFQDALEPAVFPVEPVDGVEHHLGAGGLQLVHDVFRIQVDGHCIIAFFLQGVQDGVPGIQGHFPFFGRSAHDHCHTIFFIHCQFLRSSACTRCSPSL